jgi:hypothetical protein
MTCNNYEASTDMPCYEQQAANAHLPPSTTKMADGNSIVSM